ncbi:polysaccharide biosynthesis protein [Candidatus Pelagibacter bacterium]|nr:polysaccharide biosynthesis protein [Candidatus Pelagibacter bacterium]
MFKNKVLLISGGTGSFGTSVLNRFLNSDLREIRIFSRDEKKQDDLRKFYNNPKLKFFLGDVRDYSSLKSAMKNVDFVFHAAALKQVPSCEFYPMEAIKTNILGTENLLNVAIDEKVKKVVCLSTDKAVYPINAMGMSKAMMEKIIVSKSRESRNTLVCITRYGNVMGSRGSVIPLFIDQINNGKPLTITDPSMTRFMMTLDNAVDLVLFAFKNANSGDILVQRTPACTINTLAKSILELLNIPKHPVKIIGTRHGEKLFESLISREEMVSAKKYTNYYKIPPDLRNLNYSKYIEKGDKKITNSKEYTSHNTKQLDEVEIKKILLEVDCILQKIKQHNKKV